VQEQQRVNVIPDSVHVVSVAALMHWDFYCTLHAIIHRAIRLVLLQPHSSCSSRIAPVPLSSLIALLLPLPWDPCIAAVPPTWPKHTA
jgi:hypothetical protein